jgi:hypothetical protein
VLYLLESVNLLTNSAEDGQQNDGDYGGGGDDYGGGDDGGGDF